MMESFQECCYWLARGYREGIQVERSRELDASKWWWIIRSKLGVSATITMQWNGTTELVKLVRAVPCWLWMSPWASFWFYQFVDLYLIAKSFCILTWPPYSVSIFHAVLSKCSGAQNKHKNITGCESDFSCFQSHKLVTNRMKMHSLTSDSKRLFLKIYF